MFVLAMKTVNDSCAPSSDPSGYTLDMFSTSLLTKFQFQSSGTPAHGSAAGPLLIWTNHIGARKRETIYATTSAGLASMFQI